MPQEMQMKPDKFLNINGILLCGKPDNVENNVVGQSLINYKESTTAVIITDK